MCKIRLRYSTVYVSIKQKKVFVEKIWKYGLTYHHKLRQMLTKMESKRSSLVCKTETGVLEESQQTVYLTLWCRKRLRSEIVKNGLAYIKKPWLMLEMKMSSLLSHIAKNPYQHLYNCQAYCLNVCLMHLKIYLNGLTHCVK